MINAELFAIEKVKEKATQSKNQTEPWTPRRMDFLRYDTYVAKQPQKGFRIERWLLANGSRDWGMAIYSYDSTA